MKINYMGRQVNGRYSSFKSGLKRLVRGLIRLTVVTLIFVGLAAVIGAQFFSSTVVATSEVQVSVDPAYPVLDRIAKCESGGQHYKNGQVILNANPNDTVDIGKYQVNLTYWGAKATELGLDLTKEADNYTMAKWIFHNKGTGDWSASRNTVKIRYWEGS